MGVSEFNAEPMLRRIALFNELADDEIHRIATQTRKITLARGDFLFRAGEEPQGFYIVVYGQIKLAFTSKRGDEKVVDVVTGGNSFGEAVMFLMRPYPVSARALDDALVLFVRRSAVFGEIESDPKFAARMIGALSRRIHGLMSDLEANSMHSGTQRVIGYLLRDVDVDATDDAIEIRLPISKGVMASRLSITQEHFSRILHDLSAMNLIEVDGRLIRIPSVERLRKHYL